MRRLLFGLGILVGAAFIIALDIGLKIDVAQLIENRMIARGAAPETKIAADGAAAKTVDLSALANASLDGQTFTFDEDTVGDAVIVTASQGSIEDLAPGRLADSLGADAAVRDAGLLSFADHALAFTDGEAASVSLTIDVDPSGDAQAPLQEEQE